MLFTDQLTIPGNHALVVDGIAGPLEVLLSVPEVSNSTYVAVLGHPHSLQGGTMDNKVVTTLARVCKELGVPSLRFNFRGVGQSAGVYDEGIGESEDMLFLVRQWQQKQADRQLLFAGFSFGSYVAYRAAAQCAGSLLISIAPPVHHYNYNEFHPELSSWLIVQGDADEVVPASLVKDFAQNASPVIPMFEFANTGHFFHGKLIELKAQLIDYLRPKVCPL